MQWERKSNSPGQRTCAFPWSFYPFFKVFLSGKFGVNKRSNTKRKE